MSDATQARHAGDVLMGVGRRGASPAGGRLRLADLPGVWPHTPRPVAYRSLKSGRTRWKSAVSVREIAGEAGCSKVTVYRRLYAGVRDAEALRAPARPKAPVVRVAFDGKEATITEWSQATGLKRTTLSGRLARGWSVRKALTEPAGSYWGSRSEASRNRLARVEDEAEIGTVDDCFLRPVFEVTSSEVEQASALRRLPCRLHIYHPSDGLRAWHPSHAHHGETACRACGMRQHWPGAMEVCQCKHTHASKRWRGGAS